MAWNTLFTYTISRGRNASWHGGEYGPGMEANMTYGHPIEAFDETFMRLARMGLLTLHFMRGPFWAYKRALKLNSSKEKVLGRSQWISLCSSCICLVNGDDPIPIQKDSCSQEIFRVENELTFPFICWLLYIVTTCYLEWELPVSYGLPFLP